MIQTSVGQLAAWCGGELLCGDPAVLVDSVQIDSRQCVAGCLFVALRGEKSDGGDYIEAAAAAGAVCVITEREARLDGCCVIRVENALRALQDCAAGYRRQFVFQCVAVTGSVGKTTTKEMIAAVLSARYRTLKTQGNFNSETGMPLTAFRLSNEYDAAVFEMGMSRKGEIAALTRIGKPDLAVITNIGVSHIEFLGSKHNILYAKLEIERGLSRRGVMILNGDDPMLRSVAGKLRHKTVTYGIRNQNALYRAEEITEQNGRTRFLLVTPAGTARAEIPLLGEHNVLNALAGVCVGLYSGIPLAECAAALSRFENTGMRQNLYDYRGLHLLEDCYNASPDSMRAAFATLAKQPGRHGAVVADMLELGRFSDELHREVGGFAGGCDYLIAYGEKAAQYREGALAAGLPEERIVCARDAAEAAAALLERVRPGDTVLFKGSRGLHTEDVIKILKEEWTEK